VRAWHELRRRPQAGPDKGTLYRIASRVLADAVQQRRRDCAPCCAHLLAMAGSCCGLRHRPHGTSGPA
jgi:DNA-directed RNA polymerase specialized sigma24 family protein